MISLPQRSRPEVLFAKKCIEEGLLGGHNGVPDAPRATMPRWTDGSTRDGHSGSAWFGDEKEAGGGALFDLGCHSADLARWLLGEPARVAALNNNFSGRYPIDDNMAAVVEFRSKALAMLDVSWVHRSGPNSIEIYGTEGYLTIGMSPAPAVWMQSTCVDDGGIGGHRLVQGFPPANPAPITQWMKALSEGSPMLITLDDAVNLQEMMEGIYASARSGSTYTF